MQAEKSRKQKYRDEVPACSTGFGIKEIDMFKTRKRVLNMEYKFYGWQGADIAPCVEQMDDEERRLYGKIKDPRMLYDLLSEIWCEYTCAPRLRQNWSEENRTLGQCSITAFLAQDIFGGEVYGILRDGGNYHCYNVVGDCKFDLTSEQFGDEKLDYTENPRQLREVHFAKEEKKQRYAYLREELRKKLR